MIDTRSDLDVIAPHELDNEELKINPLYPSPLWLELKDTKSMIWIIPGGRGSGKTWDVVWNLVEKSRTEYHVKAILGRLKADKVKWIRSECYAVIRYLGYELEYDMNNQRFLHKETGFELVFMPIIDEDEIRGLQGVKYVYVDEAREITKTMVDVILPSVRMEGGEVYFTFNPKYESDYLYREYVLDWNIKDEHEKIEYIKKMCGDSKSLSQYKVWNRVVTKNIDDVFIHEELASQKAGKPVKLLADTLRSQYYAAYKTAQQRDTEDDWADFEHIWKGKCNYRSSDLIYYRKVVEINALPKDIIVTERAYVDANDNERIGYFVNGKRVQLDIGADWGETNSATAIIISFDTEDQIPTDEGGILIERNCYVIGEVYLSGAECKEALYSGNEFGTELYHRIFHAIKNHKNAICRDIYTNKQLIIGDFAPRTFNPSLKALGLRVKDCIKSHESVQKKNFTDDNIDKIRNHYKNIYVLRDKCPNFTRDVRAFRRQLVNEVNDRGQVETFYEYKGSKHTMDAFRYSKQYKLYDKHSTQYITPEQLVRKSNLKYAHHRAKLTSWQKNANNIKLNTKSLYRR